MGFLLSCQGILPYSGNLLCPLCVFSFQLWPSCDFQTLRFPFFPAWKSLRPWWAHNLPLLTFTSYTVLPNLSHSTACRENDNLGRQSGVTDETVYGWSPVQLPWGANIVQGTFLILAGKLCVTEHKFFHSVNFYSSYADISNKVMDSTHSLPLRSCITVVYAWIWECWGGKIKYKEISLHGIY